MRLKKNLWNRNIDHNKTSETPKKIAQTVQFCIKLFLVNSVQKKSHHTQNCSGRCSGYPFFSSSTELKRSMVGWCLRSLSHSCSPSPKFSYREAYPAYRQRGDSVAHTPRSPHPRRNPGPVRCPEGRWADRPQQRRQCSRRATAAAGPGEAGRGAGATHR